MLPDLALVRTLAEYNVASAAERRAAGRALADEYPDFASAVIDLRAGQNRHPLLGAVAGRYESDTETARALARYRIVLAWDNRA